MTVQRGGRGLVVVVVVVQGDPRFHTPKLPDYKVQDLKHILIMDLLATVEMVCRQ